MPCLGHGVSRCSRVDTLFPFLTPGWSVAFRDGQYRAVWPGGPMGHFQSGNERWSGREGQPPGSSTIKKMLTPVGASVSPQPRGNSRHGFGRGGGGGSTRFRLISKRAGLSTMGGGGGTRQYFLQRRMDEVRVRCVIRISRPRSRWTRLSGTLGLC